MTDQLHGGTAARHPGARDSLSRVPPPFVDRRSAVPNPADRRRTAPDLKIPEGSQAISRWAAQRTHRSDPLPIANRTPEGSAEPTPAATSPGTVPVDSGATTAAEPSAPNPVHPVHPILPKLARRRRGAKTCKVPQAVPPASPVLNEHPNSAANPPADPVPGARTRDNPPTPPAAQAPQPAEAAGTGPQPRVPVPKPARRNSAVSSK